MCEYNFDRELKKCPSCGNEYLYYDDELGEEMFMSPIYRRYKVDFDLIDDNKTQEVFNEIKHSWNFIKSKASGVIKVDGLKGIEVLPKKLILESYHVGYARILKILQDADCTDALTYENIPAPDGVKAT